MRDLNYAIECDDTKLMRDIKQLLKEAIKDDKEGISSLCSRQRAIRNIKVKQKVSGQFKSLDGAKNYANIRSIIDTSRKRGLNEFESLVSVIQGNSIF